RVRYEHERDEEEQRRRQEGDRDERPDQPRPEVRAQDPPAALEDELRDVPTDEKNEQDQQDQVQGDERDQHGVRPERSATERLRQPELRDREAHDRNDDAGDERNFAAAAAHLGRKRPGGRNGRAGHLGPADDTGVTG